MANYSRELRIETDIRRKRKVEKVMEFVKKNEKDLGRSWNSIEKDLRRNKVTSRQ